MFNSTGLTSTQSVLLQQRIQQAADRLRGLVLYTLQDYQAAVSSALNRVFYLGSNVTPLETILGETPAIVGNVADNLTILNNDAIAIVQQLLNTQSDAAELYNLVAATQNSVRQLVRKAVYGPTGRRYIEAFIGQDRLTNVAAGLDFNAGVATLPLTSDTPVVPDSLRVGISSIGSTTSNLSVLTDSLPETVFTWNGSRLELVVQFNTPQIVNRITISLDDYKGLTLTELSSSPDGVYYDNILASLPATQARLDGSSGKFSGDVILDVAPRYIQQMRIVITDSIDQGFIAVRGLDLSIRKYSSQGSLQSTVINAPQGQCYFRTTQESTSTLTSISHLLSFDGVHFQSITPDQLVAISGPFYYRGILNRADANFETQSSPLVLSGSNPIPSSNFTVSSSITTDMGAGIIERVINLSSINGPLALRDTPIPGTLVVYIGAALAPTGIYSFTNNTVTFGSSQSGVSVRYQASALTSAALSSLKQYYSPFLYEISFESI